MWTASKTNPFFYLTCLGQYNIVFRKDKDDK